MRTIPQKFSFCKGQPFTVFFLLTNSILYCCQHTLGQAPIAERANSKDVILTEIFADPSPVVSLPEVEFAELYNRSTASINLAGWTFTDGTSKATLPSTVLQPGEYLILTTTAGATPYRPYGKTLGVTSFPALNNAGDALVLKDETGAIIDSVNYTDAWYRDSRKKEGGWTLERIDPENLCATSENWTASENPQGGTPGRQNSVFANKPDLTAPVVFSVIPLSASLLRVAFSEALSKNLPAADEFTIYPSVAVVHVAFADASLNTLHLTLAAELQRGNEYKLQIHHVYDCAGNAGEGIILFGLPEDPQEHDIVINEILFNPYPTGSDFVEVYNASSKYVNLKNWMLANVEADSAIKAKVISASDLVLTPGGYLALTKNIDAVKSDYPRSQQAPFLNVDVPAMNDASGSIALLNSQRAMIDQKAYTKDMHSPFIRNEEGISLERISASASSADPNNWKSASSEAGFATPGYLNSNTRKEPFSGATISVVPEIFLPGRSGSDFVQIHYNLQHGGWVANIRIFDAQGRVIKEIANNELLGTEGFYRWDGDTHQGTKARIGAYMVWVELFNTAGEIQILKRRVAIAGEF